jgi:ribonuclease D
MTKKKIYQTISKADVADMPKVAFPGRIFVIYTEEEARKAVDYLNAQRLVGVDTETRPSFKRGQMHKVALLQVSTLDTCFLFRLNRIGMPEALQDFLVSDTLKVGLSLKDDFMMLRRRKDMHPDAGNWIELQDYVPRFGIVDKSLQRIYANLFGEKISKNQRLSNWEAETLTEAQQLYAATDAWACVQIYNCLQEMERTGDYELINNQPIQQTTKIDEV